GMAWRALGRGRTEGMNPGRSGNSSSARPAKTQTDILEQAADRILRAGAGNGFWFSPPDLLAPVFFRWRRRILALHPIARHLGAHERADQLGPAFQVFVLAGRQPHHLSAIVRLGVKVPGARLHVE